jgi:hypothetical protein
MTGNKRAQISLVLRTVRPMTALDFLLRPDLVDKHGTAFATCRQKTYTTRPSVGLTIGQRRNSTKRK